MEDVTTRAITIGVGVLISIVTITAVLTYYNTAKDAVREIGSGVDIAGLYDKSIEDILLKKEVTGTDVKNILDYFAGRDDVIINVNKIKLFKNDTSGSIESTYSLYNLQKNDVTSKSNREKIIKFILPNSIYTQSYSLSGGKNTISING